jgi:hypothetical protein
MSRFLMAASVAAVLVGSASVAAAQTTTAGGPSNAPAQTEHKTAQTEIVCKKTKVTGQLLPGPKVCHTRGEWEEMSRQSQYQLERVQQQSGAHPG